MKKFLLLLLVVGLSGCQQPYSYDYLIQHPLVLNKQLEQCETNPQTDNAQVAQCQIVRQAATYVRSVIMKAQQDPEQFGQYILGEEAKCAATKQALQQAQEELNRLKTQPVNSQAPLAAAEAQLSKLKTDYETQHKEIKVLLAVVGLNSPE